MMTLIFLSLAVIIAIVVILVSAKFIKAGFDARGEVKEQQRNENVSQEDEEILDKLKDKNLSSTVIKNKFEINHRVTNKDIKIINYVYFLKNDKSVSLSTENWYNLAKINVGIPKYFDKAIKVYRSEYEKNYVQKVEKRG